MKFRQNIQIVCKYNRIPRKFRPYTVTHPCIVCFSPCLLKFLALFCESSIIQQPYVSPQYMLYGEVCMFAACVHGTEQLARHEQCVGGSLVLVHHSAVKEAVEAWSAVKRCSLMKGCTLAEQHKRKVTDLLKASVWHLLSAGETEDIMLDHA